ncbi:Cytidylyltransferase family protein [Theileria parva strain Muguga]|uniref:Phosphatidate cytidylyltransferase n=1 Tax=Theileria parva TaxID=5875 RepID=Q4N3D9_THEPA|nr:Cytidylyltransferase family protein [Theileria parva strain Muguga]EAN31400.1 Cytidylyltransferase family protein [Theileria parva strain Muguga]|eukprot:XP_763683.1 phosphatidate cytidylyltransferase [Theileria parva strain Muguga]
MESGKQSENKEHSPRERPRRFSLSNYNNFTVRTILTIFLIIGFLFIFSCGHFYIASVVVLAIIKMYYEILALHDKALSFAVTSDDEFVTGTPSTVNRFSSSHSSIFSKSHSVSQPGKHRSSLKSFRSRERKTVYFFSKAPDLLSWISLETYFLCIALVLVSVPWLVPRLQHYNNWFSRSLLYVASYHYLISFMLTMAGMIKFVISMERGRYKQHFLKLAMIVVSVLYVVCEGLMVITNIYYGMVWFLCPHVMVAVNDVLAYLFGRFVGKRPLIVISPKKTVEGFLYSALATTFLTVLITPFLLNYKPLLCPTNHFNLRPFVWLHSTNCKLPGVYQIKKWELPELAAKLLKRTHLPYSEFVLHMLVLSLFASLFAPFGGFLASGFKRALKVKDFSNVIPGHGGITDRFDCHILMGGFTYFYLKTFVRKQQLVEVVYKMFLKLPKNEQLELLSKFRQIP